MIKNVKNIVNKPLQHLILLVALLAIGSSGLYVIGEWYASSSIGYGGFFALLLVTLLNLPILVSIFGIPASLVFIFFKKLKPYALKLFLCSLVYILIGFPIARFATSIRSAAFIKLSQKPAPIITAIEQFEKDHGHPPENLSALLPKYLQEIPGTGMPAYPGYIYLTGKQAEGYDGNPWVIFIFTPRGFGNFDTFMYLPLQNYPEKGYGGTIEKMGKWAYVHE